MVCGDHTPMGAVFYMRITPHRPVEAILHFRITTHTPVEAVLYFRITLYTQVKLPRAEESNSIHESIYFYWISQRLLADREVCKNGRLSGILQIGPDEDRAFLPEKQMSYKICMTLINSIDFIAYIQTKPNRWTQIPFKFKICGSLRYDW